MDELEIGDVVTWTFQTRTGPQRQTVVVRQFNPATGDEALVISADHLHLAGGIWVPLTQLSKEDNS